MNKETDFSDKIKQNINHSTVPEIGTFAPITTVLDFEDTSRLTFTVRPTEKDRKAKEAVYAFANASSGKMVIKSKLFSSKAELETYIDGLSKDKIDALVKEFRQKTDR